ncbi:hypothetical protein ACFLSE_09925 [Bacteroidota bacterium]
MKNKSENNNRVSLIQTVQTPLGFFVLVVLIVEAIFGIAASFSEGDDRSRLIIGMLALIFLLVIIVALIAVYQPEALYGVRPSKKEIKTNSNNQINQQSNYMNEANLDSPVVVSVSPNVGSNISPLTNEFSVTFNKPMRNGWSFVTSEAGDFPEIIGKPIISKDGRTITAKISLIPDSNYAFWLNSAKYKSFSSKEGNPAVPYFVYFQTDNVTPDCTHTDFAG